MKLFSKKQSHPQPLDINWRMKPLSSAQTRFEIRRGVYYLHITHDRLKGISPRMLLWWFKHIGGTMTYNGKTYPRYRVWHPRDHIRWKLAKGNKEGKAGQGACFRIVEAFGGNPAYRVDSVEYVEKLDLTGIRLVKKIFGLTVFSLQHDFTAAGGDTLYVSNMQVGTPHRLLRYLLNPLLHRFVFTRPMGAAWLQHNIEEVGNLEQFLPALYESEMTTEQRTKGLQPV